MCKRKTALYFVVATLFLLGFGVFSAQADDDIPIIPKTETQDPGDLIPKAPIFVPIVCTLDSSNEFVNVLFLAALGAVSVEIENQSGGGYTQESVNITPGQAQIYFPGTSGSWTITFTLLNGTKYYGEFEI